MKIWAHRYTLKPRWQDRPERQGALLRVQWAPHQFGYSDLHPWTEYGEKPLDAHLEGVSTLDLSALAEISLEFSYVDAEYRRLNRNAFLGMVLPRSHALVQDVRLLTKAFIDECKAAGHTHIKMKMGDDLPAETKVLQQFASAGDFLWRLDFNGKLNVAQFTDWWESLDTALKARVDFVEDPVREGRLETRGPWANDWFLQEGASIRVVKPAREETEDLSSYRRVVFTHSLDHPIGQAAAAWSAAKHYTHHPKVMEVCGLTAPLMYEPNAFSQAWSCAGPRLKPTPGTGFGFNELLESIKWERLY